MSQSKVTFLKSVDIREAWTKEDKDFTPWLAQPEVLIELFDECDIDVGTDFQVQTEVAVPGIKRKLDVLVAAESGESIAVENQFSTVDHDHLTRGMMYAVGLKAKAVIVVAESHRPEFIALAEYLNGAAKAYEDQGISLFLVQIELLTVPGSGQYHPQFTVMARPDEWKAAVFQATHHTGERSERRVAIFNFHERMLPLLRERTGIFRNVVPSDGSWKAGSFGISSVQVKYDVAKDSVAVQLWFHRGVAAENHAGLSYLREYAADIQQNFNGRTIEWRDQNTSILETRVVGIGWGTQLTDEKVSEVVEVVAAMADIAKTHKDGLRAAIQVAGSEN